jgi:hypothetical protein
MIQLTSATRLGAIILGLAFIAAPATAQYKHSPKPKSAAQVSKSFKKGASKAAKECSQNLKDVAKDACDEIDQLKGILDEGQDPVDILDALITTMDIFHRESLAEVAATHSAIADAASLALSDYFQSETPGGMTLGDCGTLDKLNDDLASELQKTTDMVMKKIKKLAKDASKKANLDLVASLSPPEPATITPDPPETTPKALSLDSSFGANDTGSGITGMVCMSGTYDPSQGASVSVTLKNVPSQGDVTHMATVDAETCSWKLCVGGSGIGATPLPSGNFDVEIDQLQGDETFTVPGGSVGVP